MRPILLVGLILAAAPAAAADFTINVETDDRNGGCLVAFPRADGMKFEISLRASDANLNVAVHNVPSDWVDGHEDDNVQILIQPDKGDAVGLQEGGYVAGFTYRVEGWGLKGDNALRLLKALKGGRSFTVEAGDRKLGVFQIQQSTGPIRDYAWTAMQDCMKKNSGSTAF